MKKRIISSLLAATMLATVLWGCGNTQGDTIQSENSGELSEESEASEGQEVGEAAVELSFWYPISQESEANWYAMMVQKFNEEHEGEIKILETTLLFCHRVKRFCVRHSIVRS